MGLLEKALNEGTHFNLSQGVTVGVQRQLDDIERRVLNTSTDPLGYRDEVHHRLNPLTDGLFNFQGSFQETQQPTSYNEQIILKMEVSRKTHEANSEDCSYYNVN